MWQDERLCNLLGIEHPIIQVPMAGATTPEMAAAAANAGALGSLGCAMFAPERIKQEAQQTKALTNRSINLNFFVHASPVQDRAKASAAHANLAPWYDNMGAGDVPDAIEGHFPFDDAACEVVLEASPKVVSFHFGLPDRAIVDRVKQAGIVVLSSATSVAEARWLAERGVDAVIAQGYEAGGHSGWFLPRGASNVAGTMGLVPRMVDAVDVPVIAAGGIADGRGIAAALMLGAAGVQIGTAFLTTPESMAAPVHKAELLNASGDDTMLSRAFSGRNARTVVNDYASEMDNVTDWPDFPLVNAMTGPLRKTSAETGRPDAVALWSGQAVGLNREATTAQTVERLVAETHACLKRIA